MKTIVSVATLSAAICFWNVAWATEPVEQRRKLQAGGTLVVKNIAGKVEVIGTDEEAMVLSATLGNSVERIAVEGEGDRVEIVVKTKEGSMSGDSAADLRIRVPKTARTEIRCVSADVAVTDVTGAARIETVSGNVRTKGIAKSVEVKSVSGDIAVAGAAEWLEIKTVSGGVVVERTNGELDAKTVSGDVRIAAGRLTRVHMKSVSGKLTLHGDIAGDASSNFESHSGDVELALGSATGAAFEVSTFSGSLEIAGIKEAGKKGRFSLGDGAAKILVSTFSGDVRVEKR